MKLEESWVVVETSVSNYSFNINNLQKMFLAKKDSYDPNSVFEIWSKEHDRNKLSKTILILEFNIDYPDHVIIGYEGETEKVYYLLNQIKLNAITDRIIDICNKILKPGLIEAAKELDSSGGKRFSNVKDLINDLDDKNTD